MVFSFVCPVGSVFDETVQVCNFPWLAPPCVPGGDFGGNDDYEDGEELIDHQEEGSSFIPVDSDGGIYPELPPLPPGGGFIPPPFPPPPGLPPPPSPFFPGGGPPPPHLPYPPSGLPPPPPGGLFDESNNTVIDENGSVVPISTLPPRPPRPPPGGGNVPISSLPPRPPFGGSGITTPPSFGGSGGNNPSSGSISELPSFPGGFPGGNPGSNPGLGGAGGNGGNGGAVPISTLPPRPQGPPTGAPPFGSGGISNRPPSSGGGSFGGDTTMPPSSLLPPAGGSGGDSGFGTGDEDDRFDIDSIGGIPDNGIGGGGSFESTSGSDAVEISQNPPGTNNQFKVLPGSLYDCPAPGFYPYEDNCIGKYLASVNLSTGSILIIALVSEFYVCLEVLPGILNAEQLYRCPRNYLFDEDSRLCMKEEKVGLLFCGRLFSGSANVTYFRR